MELSSIPEAMDTSPRAALAELFDRAGVRQTTFAQLAGVTARQVNKWCRGRAPAPHWALLLASVLVERSPEELTLTLDKALAERGDNAPTGPRADGEEPGDHGH